MFPNANSRGQVYVIDETGRTATAVVNADLGFYSEQWARRSCFPTANTSFYPEYFQPGYKVRPTEIQTNGSQTWTLNASAGIYRAFRLKSLYGQ